MIMLRRLALVCSLVLVLLVPMGGVTASAAPGCKPYCNDTTSRIAKRIKGKGHDAWLATTLDIGGYHGKRWAEITRIPAGHGKRNIGVIHVPKRKAKKARAALSGVYFAQRGGRFVVPLKTKYDTDGCANKKCAKATKWAAKRLGSKWKVRTP